MPFYGLFQTPLALYISEKRELPTLFASIKNSITFLHRASRSLPNVIERLARIFAWSLHPSCPYYPPVNWAWKRSICRQRITTRQHMKNSFCRISGDELSLFAPIIKIHILSRKKCCQNANNVKPLCFHDFFDKIIFTIFLRENKVVLVQKA